MKKSTTSTLFSLFLLVCTSAQSADLQDYNFKLDIVGLGPVTAKIAAINSQNLMSGEAAKKAMSFKEDSSKRGAAEASIYQKVSAGTVLIATEDGLGSGAVITNNGMILTNQHVVGDAQMVKVFFKPIGGSNDMQSAVEVRGKVLKVNTKTDLALVKVENLPSSVRPIPLKMDGPPGIGEDAHAVGHPRGEVWSYTRGYISQYRTQYTWNTGKNDPSRSADVIQTQTPINPGNSGGPLVDNEGKLIGINSFGDPKSPGLNFAVASSTIQNFLKQEGSYKEKPSAKVPDKKATSKVSCGKEPVGQKVQEWLGEPATWVLYDPECNGQPTTAVIIPQNASKAIVWLITDPAGGKRIIALLDFDRDGKVDKTLIDFDGDGRWDSEGINKPDETFASDIRPIKKS